MKLKIKHTRKDGFCLVGESKVEEELIYDEAKTVMAGCDDTLLTFSYEPKGKGYSFRYYLESARPISKYLKQPLTNEYFEGILMSFLRLAQVCQKLDLSSQRVLFQNEFVFFDPARFALRFAYVPLRAKDQVSDPLKVMVFILQKATFANGTMKSIADRVLDYARSCSIFNWVDYEKLLKELGVIQRQVNREQSREEGPKTEPVEVDDHRSNYGQDINAWVKEEPKKAVPSKPPEGTSAVAAPSYSFSLTDQVSGTKWILAEGDYVLGSSDECQITVKAVGTSRRHAKLTVCSSGCTIEDLNSTNGTGINGQRLEVGRMEAVSPGDTIQLGKATLGLMYLSNWNQEGRS